MGLPVPPPEGETGTGGVPEVAGGNQTQPLALSLPLSPSCPPSCSPLPFPLSSFGFAASSWGRVELEPLGCAHQEAVGGAHRPPYPLRGAVPLHASLQRTGAEVGAEVGAEPGQRQGQRQGRGASGTLERGKICDLCQLKAGYDLHDARTFSTVTEVLTIVTLSTTIIWWNPASLLSAPLEASGRGR